MERPVTSTASAAAPLPTLLTLPHGPTRTWLAASPPITLANPGSYPASLADVLPHPTIPRLSTDNTDDISAVVPPNAGVGPPASSNSFSRIGDATEVELFRELKCRFVREVRWQRRSAMVWVAGVERERPGLGWWFITEWNRMVKIEEQRDELAEAMADGGVILFRAKEVLRREKGMWKQ